MDIIYQTTTVGWLQINFDCTILCSICNIWKHVFVLTCTVSLYIDALVHLWWTWRHGHVHVWLLIKKTRSLVYSLSRHSIKWHCWVHGQPSLIYQAGRRNVRLKHLRNTHHFLHKNIFLCTIESKWTSKTKLYLRN